ncbi:MAG TPA: NADH-quinone oxidoreductase subunit NuoK [Oligoflexia bacterium]|nr:NADH-quinone oxidoreductase subunit NuoK [Oligoflexia bacterium]
MKDFLQLMGSTTATPVGLEAYLIVAAALFVLGLTACIARRNAIGILIGIELMLNAAVLNFMAFWRFQGSPLDGPAALAGPVMGIFIIVLAACEAAVALAVLLNLYFNFGTVEVDMVHEMKE